jgi:hypothetical protein
VTVNVVGVLPVALPRTRLLPRTPDREAMEGVLLVKSATAALPASERPPVEEPELPSAELFEEIRVPLLTVVGPV